MYKARVPEIRDLPRVEGFGKNIRENLYISFDDWISLGEIRTFP